MPKVLFTTANAKEMAARSHEARRNAEVLTPDIVAIEQTPAEELPGISISCVRARLETLDKLMSKASDDKQWDAYSRAYERMFRVWCTLTKTPGPGNLKPSQPRHNQRRLPEPTVPLAPDVSSTAQAADG